MKIYPEITLNQWKGLPKLLLCSRVAPNNNMMEALMKATSYELRQRAIRAYHCDTPITVTGVTVSPERRKMPQNLISSGFEHCDRRNGDQTVTVVSVAATFLGFF